MAKKPKPKYTWGGARPGAGRPRTVKGRVPHRPRQTFAKRIPVLVSVKTVPAAGKLRRKQLLPVFRDAIAEGAVREGFRICQFSIQQNHIHLLVEADDSEALARGVQGVKIRLARGLNSALGRSGQVFGDRYHAALLTTPKRVREALAYLMQDARRHGDALDPAWGGVDPFSSAWYFDGWASDAWRRRVTPPRGEPPVAPPQTALLRQSWRRHGAIGVRERPTVALFECI